MKITSAPAYTTSSVSGTPAWGMPAACATSPRSCLLWLGPYGAGSLESVLWLQFWLQGWWGEESQEFDPYLPSSLNLKLAQGATSSCWHLGGPNWTVRSELNWGPNWTELANWTELTTTATENKKGRKSSIFSIPYKNELAKKTCLSPIEEK